MSISLILVILNLHLLIDFIFLKFYTKIEQTVQQAPIYLPLPLLLFCV